MLGPQAPVAPPRFSVSMLPVDADPAERDFVRLLERALAPSFTLVRRLGAGAMGSVYLARDPVLKRLVAVKIMAPSLASDAQARARFEREAQTVASISHPNVVAVYSVGTLENGVPYLVMQYVEGKTMAERIAEGGPLDAPTAKRVLGEVASALAAAHRKGIIHRDIKPGNILWDDETGRALVTDFGIAAVKKHVDGTDLTKLTQSGMAVGTPAYMSPEQVCGEEVTEKTDVYSLGVLGYEMLTGEGPYKLARSGEVLAAHLRDTPRKLSSMRADVDPEVERLLEDCLNKDATRRPTAQEAEDRITHGASILLEWPPPGLERLARRFRHALRPTALGAVMMGVPLTLISVFDRSSAIRGMMPPIEYVLAVATLGLFVFIAGCARLASFFQAAQKAADTGYHWGTVFETVGDGRGDTGALITGAREYATLTAARRSTLRRHRVIRVILLLVASLTPVLGFAAGVVAGARFASGPTIVLYSTIGLAAALVAAWWGLALYETQILKAARSRRLALSSVKERPTELAAAWTDSFNQVRAGQAMGPGPIGKRRRLWRTSIVVLNAAMLVAVLSELLIVVTAISTVMLDPTVPSFDVTRHRLARFDRLRTYVVPPDSSITPGRAGQALHAVGRVAGEPRRWEARPSIAIPEFRLPDGASPFGASQALESAFRAARRGLTDEERRYLKALAENPALAEFRLAANAPRLDLGSAVYDIPLGSRLNLFDLPIPRFTGIRNAALSNTAAAALDLASRQPEDAERRLREVLSVGFLLMRDGQSLHENLVGAAIVGTGRQSLEAYYVAAGREAEARLVSAASDPDVGAASEDIRRTQPSLEEVERGLRDMILDSTEVRGARWHVLMNYALLPCLDLRQLIFGADSAHVETLDAARRALVRTRSDSLLFALAEQTVDEPRMVRDGVPLLRPANSIPGVIGTALTGHRTIQSCASLLGMGSQ